MEFKQIEAYVRVYELQSFSKAADEMFLSQPSVSAYLTALEKELKTQLIYRSTREFIPTKSGRLFYEYAKDLLSLRDKSVASIKNLSDSPAGTVDILASSVPAQYILPEILGDFHRTYPDITFTIARADTAETVKGIAAHKSEIGFVGAKIENPKCVYEKFMSEKLVIIAPNRQRFKEADPKDAARLLRSEYFIAREAGSGTRLEYEGYLKKIGVSAGELKSCACFNDTQSILHAVAGGLGLSIVSELAAKHCIQQKMVIPICDASLPERHFYMVLKKNCVLSATVDAFVQFVRSRGQENGC